MSRDAEGRTLRHRLYHGETSFDYVRRWRVWFLGSALVIAAGFTSLITQGLNFGIDFKGGTSWEVEAPGVSVEEARDQLRPFGLGDAKIQIAGGDVVRVQSETRTLEDQAQVTDAMAELGRVDRAQVSVNDVGPSWGDDVTKKARTALIVFFVLITAYITLRFEWRMAVAAIVAVVHDILVTVGVYSISRFEVTPATVVAFLTILGYSLYDTIVVFDKVDENTRGLSASGRMTVTDTINLSMNQVLMRSLNTSLVAILPILSILLIGAGVLGAVTLKDFGLALLIGLLTGAYSSIFIAAPVLAMLKEREPRYAAIRQRLQAKGGGSGLLTPAATAIAAGAVSGTAGGKSKARPAPLKPAPLRPGASRPPGAKATAASQSQSQSTSPSTGDGDDALVPASPPSKPGSSKPGSPKASTAAKAGATARAGGAKPGGPKPVGTGTGAARPPANRPGAPRPRKKGKKR